MTDNAQTPNGKVKFTLDGGRELFIETDMPEKEPSRAGKLVSKSKEASSVYESNKQFTEIAQSIAPVANTILDSLKNINSPKEIQLEFGVKLDVASNVVIAKASTAANFKITLKWENKDAARTEK